MSRHEVVSPIPGVFYRRPDPDSPMFTEEGQTVEADQTICLVEVMKSFHPSRPGRPARWSSSWWRTRTSSTPASPSR